MNWSDSPNDFQELRWRQRPGTVDDDDDDGFEDEDPTDRGQNWPLD